MAWTRESSHSPHMVNAPGGSGEQWQAGSPGEFLKQVSRIASPAAGASQAVAFLTRTA